MTLLLAQVASLFTAPWLAAAGAAAVSIPIAIHLLSRLRRKREAWGAMRFLLEAYRRHKQRLRFEQWLLLLVRCLLVAVLGLALAGPIVRGAITGGLGPGAGRSVHLVLDDSLSSRADDADGQSRFDRLKATARSVIEALDAGDTVTLYRGARPDAAALTGPRLDRDQVLQALDRMRPGYGPSTLPAALEAVRASLDRDRVSPGDGVVVLLSDFPRSAPYLDEPMDDALAGLGERARVLAVRPATSSDNVQIESVAPRRRMVLAQDDASATIPVQVRLRRFGGASDERAAAVEVAVLDAAGKTLATATRRPRLGAGQSVASVNLDVPVAFDGVVGGEEGRTLLLRARLEGDDALAADNERTAVVSVRSRLRVGVVDESAGAATGGGLNAGGWLRLALQPGAEAGANGAMRVSRMLPADVSARALAELDAVMIVRPDLLPDTAWADLGAFVRAGGLVWVFAPAVETTATWTRAMVGALGVSWRVGMDVLEPGVDEPAWSLDAEAPPPEALAVLAADWADLLRPVRVVRRLPIASVPDAAWLRLEGVADGGVLLAATYVEDGAALLLGTALDATWTNLMTKPLFVPLLHESLRSLLGSAPGREAGESLAGHRPRLGRAWEGVSLLTRVLAPGWADGGSGGALSVGVQEPIEEPGVYGAAESPGLRLAVNVDADAGDTQTADAARLAAWLDGLGPWEVLEADQPAAVLSRADAGTPLGWPLLCAAMALLLLETWLARVMSHAKAAERRTWTQRILNTVRHLRHDEPLRDSDADRKGAA